MTIGMAMVYAIKIYEFRYRLLPEITKVEIGKVEMLGGAAVGDDYFKATIGITNANDIRFDFNVVEENGRVSVNEKNSPFQPTSQQEEKA